MLLLSNYNLKIQHLKGSLNPADAPSRRPDFALGATQFSWEGSEESPFLDLVKTHQLSDPKAIQVCQKLSLGTYTPWLLDNGLLLHNNLVYVPESLRLQLLQDHHDTPLAGHFGINKTLSLITCNYCWPGMKQTIENFVKSCSTCQRSKAPCHSPHGQLQLLPPPAKPWTNLTMDHIVDLPLSGPEKFDSVLVVVNRLTKMAHFILCHKTDSAAKLAHLFVKEIVRLHGLPDHLVSDRGTTFRSRFWNTLCKVLKILVHFSTAFHPQTDGQTERTNQILEAYLCSFINYLQDDWVTFLPLAKFAYNNAENASTKHSPFYANYGYHPCFSALSLGQNSADFKTFNAASHAQELEDIHATLKDNILQAQSIQARYYDQKHKPVQFQVGDQVWLQTRNIRTQRPSKKLDFQKIGPYPITAKIGPQAYKLTLPPSVQIHPVFHVSLLEPYTPNTFTGQTSPLPPPVVINDLEEFEVDQVLDCKRICKSLRYLVSWKGYGPEDNTWEPASNLANSQDLVNNFYVQYPSKPC